MRPCGQTAIVVAAWAAGVAEPSKRETSVVGAVMDGRLGSQNVDVELPSRERESGDQHDEERRGQRESSSRHGDTPSVQASTIRNLERRASGSRQRREP